MREQIVTEPICRLVAPFTGAWIEMRAIACFDLVDGGVAPFTGAWIEI